MDQEIPLRLMAQLFAEQGMLFVDDEQIPEELRTLGWRSETFVKLAAGKPEAGVYELSHLVFAPDGEISQEAARCIFEQKMRVEIFSKTDSEGKAVFQTKVEQVFPGERSLLLEAFLEKVEAAQKTLEFEVRF